MQLVVVVLVRLIVLEVVYIHAVQLAPMHAVLAATEDVRMAVVPTAQVLAEAAQLDALISVKPAVGVAVIAVAKDALVTAGVNATAHVTDAVAVLADVQEHATDAE